ncbi:MAG: DeoR/GlpR family DNA-binding transcription regulator [Oscillospiraceae bacterium]|jgi:DeoR/GlpR family transcriptional regulator of sugar metabolism
MLSVERRKHILDILKRDKRVLVSQLSAQFQVSEETIRRDLEKLEKEGYATRTYGGALLCEETKAKAELPYVIRKQTNVVEKRIIAELVSDMIRDGDFIMLDESSTSAFVARAIKKKKNITLITNSIEIILEVSGASGWNILSTGGILKPNVLALTGHQAEAFIKTYHVDLAVISCTGVDLESGFTDAGEDNAIIKRSMMKAADRTIFAIDSTKFDRKAFAPICPLSGISTIVTDREPDEKWRNAFRENSITAIYPDA